MFDSLPIPETLRARLAHRPLAEGNRLPPERVLVRELGTSRTELRKALDVLEAEGRIWRHGYAPRSRDAVHRVASGVETP